MPRTEKSIKNIKYTVGGQILALIISFISRKIFIDVLGTEYLGLDGLFTNIMSLLSLAELGIGSAITYSLYKPLAENDKEKIKVLMQLYKNAYICIAIIIAMLGLLTIPFLGYLVKDDYSINNIKMIYLLYVLNSSLSYLFSYKRSLVIADQKRYINSINHYLFFTIRNIFQIISLHYTLNFILYLIIQLITTLLENVVISFEVSKLYSFISEKTITKIEDNEKNQIKKNITALIFHKIGGVIVLGTDNIIISKFIGLVTVGIYSNYLIIINALNMIYSLIFQTLTASIGNLGVTQTKEKGYQVFETVYFTGFWIYSFSSICLIVLFGPFISLWLGATFVLPNEIVMIIVLNFYLNGMRKSVLIFKDAFGLFWFDRYKPILECLINLLVSIILVRIFGLLGVLIGTTVSIVATCLWIEPLVVYKHAFNKSVYLYFGKYAIYAITTILMAIITWLVCGLVKTDMIILDFVAKATVCLLVPNTIIWLLFRRSGSYRFLKSRLMKK